MDSEELPSSEEIDRRLRIVSEMRELCLSLGRVQLGPVTAPAAAPSPLAADSPEKASGDDPYENVENAAGPC